jgi:linoleoyl-CoA desaturase
MSVKFARVSAFHRELKARVDLYFERTGLPRRDLPQMYGKTALIVCWFAASYYLLVFRVSSCWQAVPLCFCLGLAMAAIGFNIQHDGSHGSYSRHKLVNRLAALSLDMIGGSSYIWKIRHNIIHHTYTNIVGVDSDIDLGPLGRLFPGEARRGIYRFQHLYLWIFYGFIAFRWHLFDDFRDLTLGRIGTHRIARPKGWELTTFVVGKLFALGLIFAIPATRHPAWAIVGCYGLTAFVLGLTISLVFQLAHCVEEAAFVWPSSGSARLAMEWAVWQVETTVDFAKDSRLLTWYLGGLNYQIEHHLFPEICHLHYRALSVIVDQICQEFDVRYFAHRSALEALSSHYRLLRGRGKAVATM